jgi:hypothetical protein
MTGMMTRPKPEHPRHSRTFRLPERLYQQLAALAAEQRRPVTGELELAIEAWLKQFGRWPPPEPAAKKK